MYLLDGGRLWPAVYVSASPQDSRGYPNAKLGATLTIQIWQSDGAEMEVDKRAICHDIEIVKMKGRLADAHVDIRSCRRSSKNAFRPVCALHKAACTLRCIRSNGRSFPGPSNKSINRVESPSDAGKCVRVGAQGCFYLLPFNNIYFFQRRRKYACWIRTCGYDPERDRDASAVAQVQVFPDKSEKVRERSHLRQEPENG